MTALTDPGAAAVPATAPPPAPASGGPPGVPSTPKARGTRYVAGSTPGRLRRQSIAIVVVAVLVGLLCAVVVSDRRGTTSTIADSDGPVIVSVRQFKVNLARADAAAANAF